jgi:THO complex subunit 4
VIPVTKTLAERTSQPKAQPKSAAARKTNEAKGAGASGRGKKGTRGGGRTGRPVKKTAEELDSEMADYFTGAPATNENTTTGTAAPAAPAGNGDASMEDEIM